MIAKLIVTAADREAAVRRLADALDRFEIEGLTTNLPLLRHIAHHPDFMANDIHTRWLEQTVLPGFEQSRDQTPATTEGEAQDGSH